MPKTFLTYEQQIDKLKNEKLLTISNEEYAKEFLSKLSYYSLVSGYKKLFKHAPSGKYIHGVSFEELVSFYYFDEELRTLFMKYILHVERNMKSTISYYFCEKYGEQQCEYLNPANYTITRKNKQDVQRLVLSLQKAISLPSHYDYITHHAKQYNNVPLWVAMNTFTFGQVSKIYQYIPNDIQVKISTDFENVSEQQLHQMMRVLASCRNVCAHGERLYSFHINETIPNMPLHTKFQLPQKNGQFQTGKRDLFAVVVALRYLISTEDFKHFKADLSRSIKKVLKKCPHLTEDQLLKEMGFPKNWANITRYKK